MYIVFRRPIYTERLSIVVGHLRSVAIKAARCVSGILYYYQLEWQIANEAYIVYSISMMVQNNTYAAVAIETGLTAFVSAAARIYPMDANI